MKIMQVVGTRPNFIKAAPIIQELINRGIDHVFVHTGQHFNDNMSKVFFEDFNLPEPFIYLNAGSKNGAQQIANIILRLEPAIISEKPNLVIVVGDVNSTLAAALCAIKTGTPVAHVEAGYRSGDLSMPEEVNRIVVDHISQILFAPTEDAVENLKREGVEERRIFFVGNIMAETLIKFKDKANESRILEKLDLRAKSYALATIHRAENVDNRERLESIMSALAESPIPVILPLHPRTQKQLDKAFISDNPKAGVRVISPLGYLDFLKLQSNARLVLTDSGGIQEEALLLSVPCITLRYNTERIITVKFGANRLVGAEKKLILEAVGEILLDDSTTISRPTLWDDKVACRIVGAILENRNLLEIVAQDDFENWPLSDQL